MIDKYLRGVIMARKGWLLAVCWILVFFQGYYVHARLTRAVEELSVYYKKETIGDSVFVYREDIVNGAKKEAWTINGDSVSFDRYGQELLLAEMEFRKQEKAAQEARRKRIAQERRQISCALHKRLLHLQIDLLEKALKRLDDHRLAQFLNFDKEGIISKQEFESIRSELLQEAKKILYTDLQGEQGSNLLVRVLDKLEGVPERLDDLFHATVNNAIKQCDDTRMLKELLSEFSI